MRSRFLDCENFPFCKVFLLLFGNPGVLSVMGSSDLIPKTRSGAPQNSWSSVIDRARKGCRESFDVLARNCLGYLTVAARERLASDLQGKCAPSDLVQQTLMVGYANFPNFTGNSEADLLRWMRAILDNQALYVGRFYHNTQARQVDLEVPLADLGNQAGANSETPSRLLMAIDQQERLQAALQQLPDHYRTLLKLRNFEQKTFEEIGELTGRSADAARKLWVASLRALKQLMSLDDDSQLSRT